jgi:hypothetical protein
LPVLLSMTSSWCREHIYGLGDRPSAVAGAGGHCVLS